MLKFVVQVIFLEKYEQIASSAMQNSTGAYCENNSSSLEIPQTQFYTKNHQKKFNLI